MLATGGGKQEGGQGDLTGSPGLDFGHWPMFDHSLSQELAVQCPTKWSIAVAAPDGQARSSQPLGATDLDRGHPSLGTFWIINQILKGGLDFREDRLLEVRKQFYQGLFITTGG